MLFSSVTFLFCFMPFCVIGYYALNPILRNTFLFLCSILFYAWGEPKYVLVMLGVIVVDYIFGILFKICSGARKLVLGLGVIVNLGVLGVFKYADFITENLNSVLHIHIPLWHIALPIGISFYIFQSLSYIIDVYRNKVAPQKNLLKFGLYVSLFPQLIAGPIVKYRDIADEIDSRINSFEEVAVGLRRFIIGLSKKVLIANTMGEVADKIYAAGTNDISFSIAWLGAIAYSLQILFDFSGYSDMAIGLGRVFGFHFAENFNYPYIAKSVTDFWRRWHISLSSWFKEYLYIPLGGNRVSVFQRNLNLLIVFFATGLWHGASWNFVVWGMWHGLFLLLEKNVKERWGADISHIKYIRHIYVIFVFVIGWVFFRADTLSISVDYISLMFGLKGNEIISFGFMYYFNHKVALCGIVAILLCYPWKWSIVEKKYSLIVARDVALLGLLVLSIASIAASAYNPFIYFRF